MISQKCVFLTCVTFEARVRYTDSLSSLLAIKNPNVKTYVSQIFEILGQILSLARAGFQVILQYIPGHKDIQGNELADLAAAAAHSNDIIEVNVAQEDKVRVIKKAVLSLWQASWERQVEVTQKGKHIRLIKSNVDPWSWAFHKSRAAETVLAKLRIGHANYGSHLFRFGLSPSPNCTCGNIETIRHILFNCPLYYNERSDLASKLQNNNVDFSLKTLLGGGNYKEAVQKAIADDVSYYLMKIRKLYIL